MRCGPLSRVIRGPMPTSLSEAVVLSTDVVAREGEVKECILRQPGPLFLSPCPYLQSCVLGAATLDGLRVRCGPGARAQLEQAPATPWIRLYYPLPWSRRQRHRLHQNAQKWYTSRFHFSFSFTYTVFTGGGTPVGASTVRYGFIYTSYTCVPCPI